MNKIVTKNSILILIGVLIGIHCRKGWDQKKGGLFRKGEIKVFGLCSFLFSEIVPFSAICRSVVQFEEAICPSI